MNTNELVPSLSIENLLQQRDAMVERVREAHRLLMEASALATASFHLDHGLTRLTLRNYGTGHEFTCDGGDGEMIRAIDTSGWAYLLAESGLQSFLDAETRQKWRQAIEKHDVPAFTRANIEATFTRLYEERGTMFERGVCEVFKELSWDYKTNSHRKFGKRLVLRSVVETFKFKGKTSLYGPRVGGTDKLDDLARVLAILDGKPEADYRHSTFRLLNDQKWMRDGGPQIGELSYFKIRGFQNGNAHLTFTRADLVDRMNQILGKHYPNALPPSEDE